MERFHGRRDAGRWWVSAYVVWMGFLGAAYFVWGGATVIVLLGLSSAVAIVAGIAANRPPQRAPWLMLAGAVLIGAAAPVASAGLGLSGASDQSVARLAPIHALH